MKKLRKQVEKVHNGLNIACISTYVPTLCIHANYILKSCMVAWLLLDHSEVN